MLDKLMDCLVTAINAVCYFILFIICTIIVSPVAIVGIAMGKILLESAL